VTENEMGSAEQPSKIKITTFEYLRKFKCNKSGGVRKE
jgi:hypothetical protein